MESEHGTEAACAVVFGMEGRIGVVRGVEQFAIAFGKANVLEECASKCWD